MKEENFIVVLLSQISKSAIIQAHLIVNKECIVLTTKVIMPIGNGLTT